MIDKVNEEINCTRDKAKDIVKLVLSEVVGSKIEGWEGEIRRRETDPSYKELRNMSEYEGDELVLSVLNRLLK